MLALGPIVTPVLDQESVQKLVHDVKRELAKRYQRGGVRPVRVSRHGAPRDADRQLGHVHDRVPALLEQAGTGGVHDLCQGRRRLDQGLANARDLPADIRISCRRPASRSHTGDR